MKPVISAIISLLIPSKLAIPMLNALGHDIDSAAHIGCSWLQCKTICLSAESNVGHFNLLRIDHLSMGVSASIRSYNRMKGPMSLLMGNRAAIGNSNNVYRGPFPITHDHAHLKLGELTIITSKHNIDCTSSIEIGSFTTISGYACQLWTHGFYHAETGPDRIRIDGAIKIGRNVSIGSGCLINPGVSIGNAINVGGNSTVSKSISSPGMYVSQGLRFIPNNIDTIKEKLSKNPANTFVDVYNK